MKGEPKLLNRVCELPSDLASAYLDDLKATVEERLAFFERIANRYYTKNTHDSPVSKMRRIRCEDCRVVQMQFKQTNGKWE